MRGVDCTEELQKIIDGIEVLDLLVQISVACFNQHVPLVFCLGMVEVIAQKSLRIVKELLVLNIPAEEIFNERVVCTHAVCLELYFEELTLSRVS